MGRSSGYDSVGDPRTGRPPLPADREREKQLDSYDMASGSEGEEDGIEVVDSAEDTGGQSPAGLGNFQAGQLVSLKSGGPVMTVSGTENGMVACQWFGEGDAVQTGVFEPGMLEMMEPDDGAQEGTGPPQ